MENVFDAKILPNSLGIKSLNARELHLLDEFATKAMHALIINPMEIEEEGCKPYAKNAYLIALNMIAERRKIIE